MSETEFPQAIKELLAEHEISLRELGRRVKRHGGPTMSTVGYYAAGDYPPSRDIMEIVAKALAIKPEHFAEYRLLKKRDRYDPAVVGFKAALRNLEND